MSRFSRAPTGRSYGVAPTEAKYSRAPHDSTSSDSDSGSTGSSTTGETSTPDPVVQAQIDAAAAVITED